MTYPTKSDIIFVDFSPIVMMLINISTGAFVPAVVVFYSRSFLIHL